jgi:hypothetical protein
LSLETERVPIAGSRAITAPLHEEQPYKLAKRFDLQTMVGNHALTTDSFPNRQEYIEEIVSEQKQGFVDNSISIPSGYSITS